MDFIETIASLSTTLNTRSRRDEIVAAIGSLALLIGTATGNAIAMLTIAVIAFAVISIIYRRKIGPKVLFLVVAAASIGFAVAVAISIL